MHLVSPSRALLLALIALPLAGLTSRAADGPAPTELMSNSTFQDGMQDWVPSKLEGTEATFEIKDIEGGKKALCITVPKPAEKRYYVQLLRTIPTKLDGGKSFTIAFRAKSKPGSSIVIVMSSAVTNPKDMLRQDGIELTEEWKDYSYTFTPSADTENNHFLISGLAAVAAEYWFTDITLRETPPGGVSPVK